MAKRSDSTGYRWQEYPEPYIALRALARLLGRQVARQLLAEKGMQDPASPLNQARNVFPTSNSST